MADQEKKQLNKLNFRNIRRAGGLLLLVFLFAAIAIAKLAAVVRADDGKEGVIDAAGTVDQSSAEELQYRQILQGILSSNAVNATVADNFVSCLGDLNCTANDLGIGAVSNIVVTQLCDGVLDYPAGTPTLDTLIFTADFQVNAGNAERYDIGLWFNADGTGTVETGTLCSAGYVGIDPPATDQENGLSKDPPDICGDAAPNASFTETITYRVSCTTTQGVLKLPWCATYNNTANKPVCTTGSETLPGTKAKCNCDPNGVLNNQLKIDKQVVPDGPGEPDPPQFDYLIRVENSGPILATDIQITDTLPIEVSYVSSSIVYGPGLDTTTSPTPPTSCDYNATTRVVTCGGPPTTAEYLPDMDPNPPVTDDWIEVTIRVEMQPGYPGNHVVENPACATWYALVDHDDDPLTAPQPGRLQVCDVDQTTIPVTLSYFAAAAGDDVTNFDWSTSSETANAGFNLYALVDGEMIRLNEDLILTNAVDSTTAQDYALSLDGMQGTTFYIEDVPVQGDKRMHGPFELGEVYGAREEAPAIDWGAIQAEHEALAGERQTLAAGAAMEKMEAAQPAGALAKLTTWAQNVVNSVLGKKTPLKKQLSYPAFYVKVNQDGLYRLSYEDLVAATGVGLTGVPAADLALSGSDGAAMPIYVGGGSTFGPGSYIEFYGKALDTLYTGTEVMKLSVDPARAKRVTMDATVIPRNSQPAPYYLETASFGRDKTYSYLVNKPNDPWYDTLLLASSWTPWHFSMPVDNYVPAGGQGLLTLEMWGGNDVNHHVQAKFNDSQVADLFFLNQKVMNYSGAVDLQEGANKLTLIVPNDQGADFDLSRLEDYGLVYPRAFVARADRLSFSGADDVFTVTDLSTPVAVVYRQEKGKWEKLTQLKTESNGGTYNVSFAGSLANADYHVAAEAALLTPEVTLAVTPVGLLDGQVDLLIISHPSFIDGLAPLVAAREAQGYAVKVVNVEDLYSAYTGGVFNAEAIRSYIHEAMEVMGVQYVLLVGGDTYDYRGFTNSGSMSFIPSLYAKTSDTVNFAPVDPLYTDADFDNVPEAAIGRFPVRTLAELDLMIDKTFQYENKDYQETAVFAADKGFSAISEDFTAPLQAGWFVDKAYLDQSDVATAKSTLINSLNNGRALASFVGHSGKNNWTFDGLLNTSDVAKLTNYGEAALVSQFGCWNTYYVDPNYNTLGHVFLLSGTNGASAVTGSTTITEISSEVKLGQLLMPRLIEPGITVGEAMQAAKTELAQSDPNLKDVLLGWTILGDPTTVVQP
jgi:uncharacterized repeat protein (TIGR01451 family)